MVQFRTNSPLPPYTRMEQREMKGITIATTPSWTQTLLTMGQRKAKTKQNKPKQSLNVVICGFTRLSLLGFSQHLETRMVFLRLAIFESGGSCMQHWRNSLVLIASSA